MVLTTSVAAGGLDRRAAPDLSGAGAGGAASAACSAVPIFRRIRLALAAMVPADQRRPGFALDSMIVELSFMVGPAVAVVWRPRSRPGTGCTPSPAGWSSRASRCTPSTRRPVPRARPNPAVAPPRRTGSAPAGLADDRRMPRRRSSSARPTSASWPPCGGGAVALDRARDRALVRVLARRRARLRRGPPAGVRARPGRRRWGCSTIPVGLAPSWPWLVVALIPAGLLCAPTMPRPTTTWPGRAGESRSARRPACSGRR